MSRLMIFCCFVLLFATSALVAGARLPLQRAGQAPDRVDVPRMDRGREQAVSPVSRVEALRPDIHAVRTAQPHRIHDRGPFKWSFSVAFPRIVPGCINADSYQ